MINFEETEVFVRDFKKLRRKFSSLPDDLEILKQYEIKLFHLKKIDKHGIIQIQGVGNTNVLQFYKIKKFACKSLKGRGANSGLRVIYAYFPEKLKVVFLEIYFKATKENENRQRIIDFIKSNEKN